MNVPATAGINRRQCVSSPLRVKQAGIVLIVALLVLVALSIASIGLLRSVDTTTTVTGNLGFKKDLYRQSNVGINQAMTQLIPLRDGQGQLPGSNSTGVGYYAQTGLAVDGRGIPLILVNAAVPSAPGQGTSTSNVGETAIPVGANGGGGYLFRYVAERLCPTTGAPNINLNPCRQAAGAGAAAAQNHRPALQQSGTVYVRLTLRVDGPKNSVSYFQAMVL